MYMFLIFFCMKVVYVFPINPKFWNDFRYVCLLFFNNFLFYFRCPYFLSKTLVIIEIWNNTALLWPITCPFSSVIRQKYPQNLSLNSSNVSSRSARNYVILCPKTSVRRRSMIILCFCRICSRKVAIFTVNGANSCRIVVKIRIFIINISHHET